MKQPIQVVMLPTEDRTNILKETYAKTLKYSKYTKGHADTTVNQHLYITISQDVEPIKDGDWFYSSFNDHQPKIQKRSGKWKQCFNQRKIIATTDPKLTEYCKGVHRIGEGCNLNKSCNYPNCRPALLQQSFLKEFVKNPNGKWEVEYEQMGAWINEGQYFKYVSIRPKLNKDDTVNITSVEKKMYDIKKIKSAFCAGRKLTEDNWEKEDVIDWNNWIEQNL